MTCSRRDVDDQQPTVTDAATINQIVNQSSNNATLAYGVDVVIARP